MLYPEGEGVQFFREFRVLSEMLTIFLIRKFDVIYKFTEEEVKKLREYILISGGDMSNNISNIDKHMDALSNLIKNPELDTKKIYELNHRMVIHNTVVTDLIINGKLQQEDLAGKSYENLNEIMNKEYKNSAPIPFLDVN